MSRVRAISALAALVVAVGVALLALGGGSDGDDGGDTTRAAGTGVERSGWHQGEPSTAADKRDSDAQGDAASSKAAKEIRRLQRQRAAGEPSEDEQKAQASAQRFYDILAAEKGDRNSTEFDSAGFCDLMSEQAREQTIEYASRSSGIDQEWNCQNSVELLVIRSKRTGGFKQTRQAKIVGVNAEGDRATATVRFGKGPLTSIPLVKEGGEWRLGIVANGGSGEG